MTANSRIDVRCITNYIQHQQVDYHKPKPMTYQPQLPNNKKPAEAFVQVWRNVYREYQDKPKEIDRLDINLLMTIASGCKTIAIFKIRYK